MIPQDLFHLVQIILILNQSSNSHITPISFKTLIQQFLIIINIILKQTTPQCPLYLLSHLLPDSWHITQSFRSRHHPKINTITQSNQFLINTQFNHIYLLQLYPLLFHILSIPLHQRS